jgi:hypothetical protein
VLRVSLLFYASLLLAALFASTLLWLVASQLSVLDNVEEFMGEMLSIEDFEFVGSSLLRVVALAGAMLVVLGTVANVLLAMLYNLISDVVGGVELTLLEEHVPAPADDDATEQEQAEPVAESVSEPFVEEPAPAPATTEDALEDAAPEFLPTPRR